MNSLRNTVLAAATLSLAAALPASAQHTAAVGVTFQGLSFDGTGAAEAADVLMVPLAWRWQITDRLSADLYGAWARGSVETAGGTFEMDGFVDTQLRGVWQASDWAILSLALNVPTGEEELTAEESRVVSFLSSDLFGFRASTWGTGFGVTTGVATATRMGEWGVGAGASYRLTQDYDFDATQDVSYEPGNELRLRLGFDRNVGESAKFTAQFQFQDFAEDEANGLNLFQAGNRFRTDLTYQFRYADAPWTFFLTDVWREEGDLFLYDDTNALTGIEEVGWQNLLILGVTGTEVFGGMQVRPMLDVRWQDREADFGSGWMVGTGAETPMRVFGGYDLVPRARFLFGAAELAEGNRNSFIGGEVGAVLRLRF